MRSSAVELFWRRMSTDSLSGHAARLTNCASPTSSSSPSGRSSGSLAAASVDDCERAWRRGDVGCCTCGWDSLNSCSDAATLRATPEGEWGRDRSGDESWVSSSDDGERGNASGERGRDVEGSEGECEYTGNIVGRDGERER